MKQQDLADLKQLIDFLKEHQVAEFDLDRGDLKIRLKFNQPGGSPAGLGELARWMGPAPPAVARAAAPHPAGTAPAAAEEADPNAGLHVVKSPIVGTYYGSPSPGASAFVSPGDHVDKGQASVPSSGEATYVVLRPGGKNERDRGQDARCDASAPKNEMNERTACTSIAIHERMNGLELRMGDCRLRDGRKRVVVGEGDKVRDEVRDELGGRRDEYRGAWIVCVASDPVLLFAELAAVLLKSCPCQ